MAPSLRREHLLAHHPLCGCFEADLLKLGPYQLCLGCTLAYPLALLVVLFWWLWGLPGIWWQHLLAGLLCGSIQFLSLAGLTLRRPHKLVVKSLLGLGMGLTTVGVLALPVFWTVRLMLLLNLSLLATMLGRYRIRGLRRVCEACVWEARWRSCPGLVPPHGWREPPRTENVNP